MFWKKKIKSPISEADEVWLNESLSWLREAFTEKHFQGIQTITPTTNFYNRTFDRTKEDAHFVFERTKELMAIQNDEIQLDFFDNNPKTMENGKMLSSPSENIEGTWSSAVGYYEEKEGEKKILIEVNQLNDTSSLIATMTHELAHEILLGEGWLEENDEYLTDLTAIFYGFGVFTGNSRVNHTIHGDSMSGGWESFGAGYLPLQIIAYATAWLSYERNEEIHYTQFMTKSFKKYTEQAYAYIEHKNS